MTSMLGKIQCCQAEQQEKPATFIQTEPEATHLRNYLLNVLKSGRYSSDIILSCLVIPSYVFRGPLPVIGFTVFSVSSVSLHCRLCLFPCLPLSRPPPLTFLAKRSHVDPLPRSAWCSRTPI
jgi:hypothetical protein